MSRYKELFKAAWLIGGRSVMVNQVCIPTLKRGNEVKEVSVQYQVGCHSCDSVDSVESRACPQGYKQTEIGVVPEDWDVQPIGAFAEVSSGGTPNREIKDYWNGNIPWITTTLFSFPRFSVGMQTEHSNG